jgi:hypothetical protein
VSALALFRDLVTSWVSRELADERRRRRAAEEQQVALAFDLAHAKERSAFLARKAKRRARALRERDVAGARLNEQSKALGLGRALDHLRLKLHQLETAADREPQVGAAAGADS